MLRLYDVFDGGENPDDESNLVIVAKTAKEAKKIGASDLLSEGVDYTDIKVKWRKEFNIPSNFKKGLLTNQFSHIELLKKKVFSYIWVECPKCNKDTTFNDDPIDKEANTCSCGYNIYEE